MNLQDITWQSMDDVLETRNENGHLKANILFTEGTPTIEEMDGFQRVLCFVKGKVTGGTAKINRTKVVLNEENNYIEVHPIRELDGDYETIGIDTSRIKTPVLGEGTITIEKSTSLTTPGTYTTTFAFFGEDWAEIFVVQIVVTVPLRVRTNNVDYTNGQTMTINLTAPNYSQQYLYVYGSRNWTLEGVEAETVSVTPRSGAGYDDTWSSTTITVGKPSALAVSEPITTTFRILAQSQWVDVVINLLPPTRLQFVAPSTGEVGAPAGTHPVYLYI